MYTPSQIISQNMQGAITQLYSTRVFNKREIKNGVSFCAFGLSNKVCICTSHLPVV